MTEIEQIKARLDALENALRLSAASRFTSPPFMGSGAGYTTGHRLRRPGDSDDLLILGAMALAMGGNNGVGSTYDSSAPSYSSSDSGGGGGGGDSGGGGDAP